MQIGEARHASNPDVNAGDSVAAADNDSFAALIGAASAAVVVFLVMVIAVGVFFYCRRVKVGPYKFEMETCLLSCRMLSQVRDSKYSDWQKSHGHQHHLQNGESEGEDSDVNGCQNSWR